ncbi:MAG TPA: hypothetical protein PKJ41_01555 [Bryobacteraceae bacterium]|nr:hypothetical protein [Bryobacteraceae bacterium]HPT25552.1 hypothetical protein [Bryobacteraceae bacterium]
MLALTRFFDRGEALVILKPETFIDWHRAWPENQIHSKKPQFVLPHSPKTGSV